MTRRIAYLLSLSLLAACQPRPNALSEGDVAAIRQLNARYISTTLAEDWDGWASQLTEDAVFSPPNGPAVEGRAAIRKWIPVFAGLGTFTAPVLEVTGSGPVAYARGTYAYSTGPKAAVQGADSGKWLTTFDRQADGSWRIKQNIWNSSQPLPPPPAAKPAKPATKATRK